MHRYLKKQPIDSDINIGSDTIPDAFKSTPKVLSKWYVRNIYLKSYITIYKGKADGKI